MSEAEKICLSDFTLDHLTAYIVGMGQPKFRAKQIFKWLHQKMVTEFAQMTDQPKALLALLEEQCTIAVPQIRRRQQSKDGTVKYLLQLADGNITATRCVCPPRWAAPWDAGFVLPPRRDACGI